MTTTAGATEPPPSDTRRSGPFAPLADRLAAADPAFSRSRLASSAMLSLAIGGGAVALVAAFHPLPVATYGLVVVMSFVCTLAVREPTARGQLVTRLHAFWAASLSAFAASLLAPQPVIADIAFLAVIFASVYVRRYGPRWLGVGMAAVLAYFIGEYLRPPAEQIGWLVLGTALALAATHLVTTVLLPADPERDFRRAMTTIDHRINLILRHLLRMRGGHGPRGDDDKALRKHLASLRDIALMAEGFIPQGTSGALAARGPASDLAIALFDLQLAVERLVRARHTALPGAAMVSELLDERGSLLRQAPDMEQAAPPDLATQLLLRLRDARVRINRALGPEPSPAFLPVEDDEAEAEPATAAAETDAEGDKPARPLVPETLQRPIQVTLACALALGAGILLSPTRWYWAVLTAFIVFNNTRSRADTAMRAFQRSAGTLGGLFAGTAVATLLQGHMVASGIAIPILFFLAFYFLQTSYGVMIFFVTIALALLYGLMGMFTPQLLMVRLEETLVGGVAGVLVAFLVFPVRTSGGVEEAVGGFVDALDGLVAEAGRQARGEPGEGDLAALSRALDRRYGELAAAVKPLAAPWSAVTRFGHVRRNLLPFTASAHWGRVLAQTLATEAPLSAPEVQSFDQIAAELSEQTRRVRAAGTGLFLRRRAEGTGEARAVPPVAGGAPGDEGAVQALEAIRDRMRRLNQGAGAVAPS
ncbi:FUSC family protein [Aquicoccus sp. SCR17]|nr:FUSC family protein [Carideicomes alvinocaridis]